MVLEFPDHSDLQLRTAGIITWPHPEYNHLVHATWGILATSSSSSHSVNYPRPWALKVYHNHEIKGSALLAFWQQLEHCMNTAQHCTTRAVQVILSQTRQATGGHLTSLEAALQFI